MAITTEEAQEQILDDLSAAVDAVALAVARLGEAYDRLSVTSASRLESELFRPTQKAFGRSKRAYAKFAERCGVPAREFESPSQGQRSQAVKEFIEQALAAAAEADRRIAELQDSMMPTEFGDAELRAGLAEVRSLLGVLPGAAREFLRTLGR
jgi:hypothetical protein